MTLEHMNGMCDAAAVSLGVPHRWVRAHVYSKLGKPCFVCSGHGHISYVPCTGCGGSGGYPSPVSVASVLGWIKDNFVEFRREAEQDGHDPFASLQWKMEHPQEWVALCGLNDCDFKRSLMIAVENGTVTEGQTAALRKMVKVRAPSVGSDVSVSGKLLKLGYGLQSSKGKVFQVDVDGGGWRCRAQAHDQRTIDRLQRENPPILRITGRVVWSQEHVAVVDATNIEW